MNLPVITSDILYAIIGACVLFLIVMYIIQQIKNVSHKKRIKRVAAQYDEAKQQLAKEKQRLLDQIALIYGTEQANYIAIGKIWEGMPLPLLMIAKGKASHVKQSVDTNGVSQQWLYSSYDEASGRKVNNLEVIIVNNHVKSWTNL